MQRTTAVTLADLVVLSMLTEAPLHGYELWAELERRQVAKWASITKTQVYYSLHKLETSAYIETTEDQDAALGPKRKENQPTDTNHHQQTKQLAHPKWATQRPPDPFLTWLVLSWLARPRDFAAQIARRRKFVAKQLDDDRAALDAIIAETSPTSDAAMIVRLGLRQFEVELAWLDEVAARPRPG